MAMAMLGNHGDGGVAMTTAVALVVVAVAMAVVRDGVSNESRTDDLPGHISWSAVRRRSVQFIAAPAVMSGCLVVLSAAGDQHTMTVPIACNIMGAAWDQDMACWSRCRDHRRGTARCLPSGLLSPHRFLPDFSFPTTIFHHLLPPFFPSLPLSLSLYTYIYIPVVMPLSTCKSTDTVKAVHLASSFFATI
jgi:hypothetical protein